MTSGPVDDNADVRRFLTVIKRNIALVVVAVVASTGFAATFALLQTPIYEGRSELLMQPRDSESLFDPNTGQRSDPVRAIDTEIQVLQSQPVRVKVRERIGAAPRISALPVGQTDIVRVIARSTRPAQAALIANTYAQAYIEFRRTHAVNDLLAAGAQIQSKLSDIEAELAALNAQKDTTSTRRASLVQQEVLFRERLDELQVDASLKAGGAQLVTPATAGVTPVEPQPLRSALLAAILGLIVGLTVPVLADYLDDTVKAKDDLEQIAPELPVLAMLPAVEEWRSDGRPQLASQMEAASPAAEAYRTLRTSIQFTGLDRPIRTLLVTSPSAGEGKTTTVANLGVVLSRAGQRVVIVCCDLRRPTVHYPFGLSNEVGFTSVLLGEVPLASALQRVPNEERLVVLASGPPPPNPSELLASERTMKVLTALESEADLVLIDCPPVLPVTDAALLSTRVDAAMLVVAANKTHRSAVKRALEILRQVDAPMIGVVLNGVGPDATYGYEYRYDTLADTGRAGRKSWAGKI